MSSAQTRAATRAEHAGAGEGWRSGRFIAGDPLRGVAALAVVIFHIPFLAYLSTGMRETFEEAFGGLAGHTLSALALAINVFFVLSGYLIARPFVHAIINGRALPSSGRYLRNRVLRIVPLFWFVVAVGLLRHGLPDGGSVVKALAIFGFAQQYAESDANIWIGQGWTLDHEAAFYVTLPVVALAAAWALRGRLTPRGRALVLLAGTAAIAVLSRATVGLTFDRAFPPMVFAFTPGIALAIVEPLVAPRLRGARWVGPAAALLALGGLGLWAWWELSDPLHWNVKAGLAASASGAVVAAALIHQWATGGCTRLLDNRILHWVGERSYSLYIVHLLVLVELTRLAGSGHSMGKLAAVIAVPGLAVSLAVSAATYRWVERPFLALKTRPRSPRADAASTPRELRASPASG
jgi:peptidoglycan/LPS O-acetylase OafA/YrhL